MKTQHADSDEGGHRFQFDRGHHSNLMAARLASSRGPILYQLPETPTLPVSPGIPRFPEPPKYDSLIPDQTDSLDRRAT